MGTKRILAILLIMVLLVSLNACEQPSPIAGTWVGELDYSQILQEEFADEELWEDTTFQDIRLQIVFEFRQDGSFSTQIDKESADAMVRALLDLATDGMIKALEQQDSSLEALGMTKEDLQKKLQEQVDVSSLTDPLEFAFGSGYYVCRDNCIYIGSQVKSLRSNPRENAAEILEVTLGDSQIVVTDLDSRGDADQGFLPGLLPFTLIKQ